MTPDSNDRTWHVLLIGGNSASGKTTLARQLGLLHGISWMMVDDLRLAFQRARAHLPEGADALYFDKQPNYWTRPPREQCDALIGVGEALSAPLEVVIENHVDQATPIVIEGDGILPSLLSRPPVVERAPSTRAVFLVEQDESAILANIVERGRHVAGWAERDLRNDARSKWLFGQWLVGQAASHDFQVIEPRPWETLQERVLGIVQP